MSIYFNTFKKNISPCLDSLRNLNFSYLNPLFWIFLLLLFLILLKFWKAKKSFSFCLILAIILLATTKLENVTANIVAKFQGEFDPIIIRALSGIIIVFVSLYYFLIKED